MIESGIKKRFKFCFPFVAAFVVILLFCSDFDSLMLSRRTAWWVDVLVILTMSVFSFVSMLCIGSILSNDSEAEPSTTEMD